LQRRGHQVAVLIVDQQRQVDVLVVERVERREFLLAMGRVRGRVQVEDEALGALGVAREVRLQDHPREQVAALGPGLILEPAQRRLAGKVVAGEWITAAARLEDRIAT
jgi:hypothetical protein